MENDQTLIRIKNLRRLKLGAEELAQKCPGRYTYWRDVLAGEKSFGEKKARDTEDRLGLPRGWFDEPNSHVPDVAASPTTPPVPTHAIRLTDITAELTEADEALPPRTLLDVSVDPAWLHRTLPSRKVDGLALFTATGDAMGDTIRDGDVLVLDRAVTEVRADGVYAFEVDGAPSVKRIQRRPGGGLLILADNDRYQPDLIDPKDTDRRLRILGKVVFCWQGRRFT